MRLVGFREMHPTHTVFDWVDMGPKSSPLDAPTVAIAQSTSDQNIVNVTVSSLTAGEAAIVEAVVGTTAAPTQWDYVRADVGNETVAFNIGPAEGTAWGRARATKPGRIRSAWATDSVTLATRAKLEKAEVWKSDGGATVEWTVGSTSTKGVRTTYDIHERNEAYSLANSADYEASDGGFSISSVSTREVATVKLVPYTGWNSTAGTVSGSSGDPLIVQAFRPRLRGGRPGIDPQPGEILHHREATRSVTGTTAATTLQTVTVPPLTSGAIRVKGVFGSASTGGTKSIRIRHNGLAGWSLTLPASADSQTLQVVMRASGSATLITTLEHPAQEWPVTFLNNPVSDLSVPRDVTFVAQQSNAGDTTSLFLSEVEWLGDVS